jgi:ABC-type sugar transport system ATPase subunit
MTVTENMEFGLRMRGELPAEIIRRVEAAADTLKIRLLMDRRPADLSGGQRQRVARGRAIVRAPEAFLFDEPLSNLDAALRVEMRLEMARLHRRMRATTVYVTHDQVEAMTLADRIVVMNTGRIEQIGRPLDLYRRPAGLFVARFIGSPTMNTLTVDVLARDAGSITCALPAGPRSLPCTGTAGNRVTIGIRPEDLLPCAPAEAWFSGELSVVERLGSQTFGHLDIKGGADVNIEFPRLAEIAPGDVVSVKGDLAHVHLFDSESGDRLN